MLMDSQAFGTTQSPDDRWLSLTHIFGFNSWQVLASGSRLRRWRGVVYEECEGANHRLISYTASTFIGRSRKMRKREERRWSILNSPQKLPTTKASFGFITKLLFPSPLSITITPRNTAYVSQNYSWAILDSHGDSSTLSTRHRCCQSSLPGWPSMAPARPPTTSPGSPKHS